MAEQKRWKELYLYRKYIGLQEEVRLERGREIGRGTDGQIDERNGMEAVNGRKDEGGRTVNVYKSTGL